MVGAGVRDGVMVWDGVGMEFSLRTNMELTLEMNLGMMFEQELRLRKGMGMKGILFPVQSNLHKGRDLGLL